MAQFHLTIEVVADRDRKILRMRSTLKAASRLRLQTRSGKENPRNHVRRLGLVMNPGNVTQRACRKKQTV